MIRDFIAAQQPADAGKLSDFLCTTLAGMSASAPHGQTLDRLLATAQLASTALAHALAAE